jgi:hypothetical protein
MVVEIGPLNAVPAGHNISIFHLYFLPVPDLFVHCHVLPRLHVEPAVVVESHVELSGKRSVIESFALAWESFYFPSGHDNCK